MAARRRLPPVVLVGSGKGGVGKTTVAVNIAVALARSGRRVGLLDADVHGPDVLRMLGRTRRRDARSLDLWTNPASAPRRLLPVEVHGVRVMSVHLMLGESQDFSAPGFAGMLLDRLLLQTDWSDAELLVVDLPPGTGDAVQHVIGAATPVGAVVVVTPQDVAHLDARKLVTLLRRWKTPIIGGVENMAALTCPCCASTIDLFPATPRERTIWADGIDVLGRLPFSPVTSRAGEDGVPPERGTAEGDGFADLAARLDEHVFAGS